MQWSPEDWARLGANIRGSREAQGYSRRALAEASGVSEKSIQIIEEGRVPTRWPKSLNAIEAALDWVPGTMKHILDGGTNTPTPRRPAMTRYIVALDEDDDLIIEDPGLEVALTQGWAIFSGPDGIALAIPAGRVRSIQRLDQTTEETAEGA